MTKIRFPRYFLCLALLAVLASACSGAPRDASGEKQDPSGRTHPQAGSPEMTGPAGIQPLNLPPEYWKDLVSPEAWNILFREGTEHPFSSPLNDEHRDGTFICAACYLPLFESKAKFDSGTGWPSFFEPIKGHVAFKEDYKLVVPRTEYHCVRCGGHQGHVFDDGPKPTGQRWCNNGLALKFIPQGEALPPLRGEPAATSSTESGKAEAATAAAGKAIAIFAGGCFWCVETAFEGVPGVLSAVSGYTGGHTDNPTYDEVNTHTTGHVEAVEVTYDPSKITYDRLLDIFWVNVDATDAGGQFCDRGNTYVSAIFYADETQRRLAEASLDRARTWLKVRKPIVTPIRPAATFFPAEEYHQDFYRKSPDHYSSYRTGCRRDARLKELWGDRAHH